jgi:hypothetical protein
MHRLVFNHLFCDFLMLQHGQCVQISNSMQLRTSNWGVLSYLSVTHIQQKGWDIWVSILVSSIWLWGFLKTNNVAIFKL